VLACGTVADGRKALILSAVLIFPLFLIFLLVGVMLWVFYQTHPFRIPLPEGRPGIKSFDFIFPIFMITEVPHILKGFLIVAILSAAMSSISSAITSLASVSTMDFVKQMLPHRDDEFFLRFSKYSSVFWAGVLVLTAWLTREVTFVLNAAFSLRGLTSGALLGGLILGPVLALGGRPRGDGGHDGLRRPHESHLLASQPSGHEGVVDGNLRRRSFLAVVHLDRHCRHASRRWPHGEAGP
jgi:Na+/proline symporter